MLKWLKNLFAGLKLYHDYKVTGVGYMAQARECNARMDAADAEIERAFRIAEELKPLRKVHKLCRQISSDDDIYLTLKKGSYPLAFKNNVTLFLGMHIEWQEDEPTEGPWVCTVKGKKVEL
jgi:hypothetical protein